MLTKKQSRFVDEYFIDLNAAAAARRAGYSAKRADAIGYDLLRKAEIQGAIETERKRLATRAGVTRERIVDEMAKIAFSDLRLLFDANGRLKHPTEWPDGAPGAVAGVDIVEELREDDGKGVIGYTKKLKLWDKGKQLENLLKYLGMDADKAADAPSSTEAALAAIDLLGAKMAAKFTPKEG